MVHSSGVSSAISAVPAAPRAQRLSRRLLRVVANRSATPQTSAISIIEIPIMFRTSTRNRSVHGAHPQAIRYSCRRKSKPKAKISAPRRKHRARDFGCTHILANQFVDDQRERNAGQK